MRRTSLTVALIVVLNLPAFGGYIENYASWRTLNEGQKLKFEVVADRRTGKSSADRLSVD